jgi:Tfp pilus assembly protein PilP
MSAVGLGRNKADFVKRFFFGPGVAWSYNSHLRRSPTSAVKEPQLTDEDKEKDWRNEDNRRRNSEEPGMPL